MLIGCIGLAMMQLGANQIAGFAFAVVGFIAALLTWPDAKRAEDAQQDREASNDNDDDE